MTKFYLDLFLRTGKLWLFCVDLFFQVAQYILFTSSIVILEKGKIHYELITVVCKKKKKKITTRNANYWKVKLFCLRSEVKLINDFRKNLTWIYFHGYENMTNLVEENFCGFTKNCKIHENWSTQKLISPNLISAKVNLLKVPRNNLFHCKNGISRGSLKSKRHWRAIEK